MSQETQKSGKRISIQIELDPEMACGTYVNMARIFHNQTEFVIDGLFVAPGDHKAAVRARLILSPVHAKTMQAALAQNVSAYEEKFGVIPSPGRTSKDPGPRLH